jgi:hypothetical protein
MDLVDLEFLELGCLAGKKWSGAVFVDLELRGALPNTPLKLHTVGDVDLSHSLGIDFGCAGYESEFDCNADGWYD